MEKFFTSSEGQGLKLRIKAFIPLIVPILNGWGDRYGITFVSENFELWLDSIFIFIFAYYEIKGWVRAVYNKKIGRADRLW